MSDSQPHLTAVFSAAFLGGAEQFNFEYIREASACGVRIDVILPAQGDLLPRLRPLVRSTQIVEIPTSLERLSRFDARPTVWGAIRAGASLVPYAFRLLRAIRRTRGPICCFGLRAQLAIALLKTPLRRRPILWVVHEVVPAGRYAQLWSAASRQASEIYAYSWGAAEQDALRGQNVHRMAVRLDLEGFAQVVEPRFPPRVIGLIGHLFPLKNHLALLDISRRLRARGLDIEGLLVGGAQAGSKDLIADYIASVHAAVADPATASRLISVPPERMPEAMAEIDVVLHLSLIPETFGRVCAEAMAAGRPIVAYKHGAVAEIVEHQKTGILCPAHDIDAVERAVLKLCRDGEAFWQMSRAGRSIARHRYGELQVEPTIGEALAEFAFNSNVVSGHP